MQPRAYQCRASKLAGRHYAEIERQARKLHNQAAARTKRNPYVRSVFFHKDKVFIGLFWQHLNQKPQYDRKRRLRYYGCALELLRHSTIEPAIKENPNKSRELFYVQVKEVRRTSNKFFMSVFPAPRKK